MSTYYRFFQSEFIFKYTSLLQQSTAILPSKVCIKLYENFWADICECLKRAACIVTTIDCYSVIDIAR